MSVAVALGTGSKPGSAGGFGSTSHARVGRSTLPSSFSLVSMEPRSAAAASSLGMRGPAGTAKAFCANALAPQMRVVFQLQVRGVGVPTAKMEYFILGWRLTSRSSCSEWNSPKNHSQNQRLARRGPVLDRSIVGAVLIFCCLQDAATYHSWCYSRMFLRRKILDECRPNCRGSC